MVRRTFVLGEYFFSENNTSVKKGFIRAPVQIYTLLYIFCQ